MTKKIIIIILFFTSFNCFSQESIVDKAAKKTCEYLKNLDLENLTKEERNLKLGLYIFKLYNDFQTEFNKEGILLDLSKGEEEGRKFGMKIGTSMIKFCPEILLLLAEDKIDKTASGESAFSSYKGRLKDVSGTILSTISLVDNNKRTQKFIWLNNFEGSDRLIKSYNVKGLKVQIFYKNTEIYAPQLKEYIVKRQVTKIEYLD
jgi:hypothetical protein